MSKEFFIFSGGAGSIMSLTGALPQIVHLLKVKDSKGQSILAWSIWFGSNIMIMIYAFTVKDPVFIFLQTMWVILSGFILFLIIFYKKARK